MPGALLAVALGVGGAGPAAAASVVLEPVPWSEAGVDTSQPGAPLQLEVICSAEVPGTCVSGVHGFPVQDRISFSDGEVVFEADFVSKVSGNLWAYGLRNLALSVPDEIVHFAVERFDVFAAFQVPSDGADRRVPLVMRATPAMSFIEGQSAADGPVLLRNFGTVELFEPADEITVFDEGFWSSGRG